MLIFKISEEKGYFMGKLIKVEVKDVLVSAVGFVVVLYDKDKERVLPIFIGPFEASGILMKLRNQPFVRPITYDLFKNTLEAIGARVKKVVVNDLREETFYAILYIETDDGRELEIDSRPSDAIAMALRFEAPIYVEEHVMELAGVPAEEILNRLMQESVTEVEEYTESSEETEDLKRKLEDLEEELRKAIEEERFEDAAMIRDEIEKIKKKLGPNQPPNIGIA